MKKKNSERWSSSQRRQKCVDSAETFGNWRIRRFHFLVHRWGSQPFGKRHRARYNGIPEWSERTNEWMKKKQQQQQQNLVELLNETTSTGSQRSNWLKNNYADGKKSGFSRHGNERKRRFLGRRVFLAYAIAFFNNSNLFVIAAGWSLFFPSVSQLSKFSGVFFRVNDAAAYVSSIGER